MAYPINEADFFITDYIERTGTGFRVAHFLGEFSDVIEEDLKMLHNVLTCRIRAFNHALESKHYKKAVNIVVPERRISLIVELAAKGALPAHDVWELAREAWIFQKSIHGQRVHWELFFNIASIHAHNFMVQSERDHLHKLPDEIDIYRGYDPKKGREGLSWTMSKIVASNYSRINGNHIIAHARVNKSDVVGYINVANEHEIIIPNMSVIENFRAVNVVRLEKYRRWQGIKAR